MPRTHDAHWVGFQATAAEKEVLDNYCQQMQQSKTQVLRSLINTLSYPAGERSHWLLMLTLGASHAAIVDQHCHEHKMLPNDVVRYAIELLGRTEIMQISGDDAKTFIEMINNPPETTEGVGDPTPVGIFDSEQLKDLMRSKAPWESSVITEKSEIKPWLESIMAEANKELAFAEQLRANAAQLQSIAAHMITAAECLETR